MQLAVSVAINVKVYLLLYHLSSITTYLSTTAYY